MCFLVQSTNYQVKRTNLQHSTHLHIINSTPITDWWIDQYYNFNHQCSSIRKFSSLLNSRQTWVVCDMKPFGCSLLSSELHYSLTLMVISRQIHRSTYWYLVQKPTKITMYTSILCTVHMKDLKPQLIHRISICFKLKYLFQFQPF